MSPLDAAARAMDHPWRWGTHDCCASACTAFALLRGFDPMAPLRGTYSSAEGAAALIEEHGGWEAMADALARRAALARVAGGAGALGLATGPWGFALVLGIGAGLWAGKTTRGFQLIDRVEMAWA